MSGVRDTSGVTEAIKKLREFLRTQETVPQAVMASFANELKAEIIKETPFKSGALEKGVYVNIVKLGAYRTTLTAGANAHKKGYNYATIQHENTSYNHPIKGKAKYVEDPFERTTDKIKRQLEQGIQYPE